eukprot:scaffold97515_cov63-Phaeocystis_antarctica.AAC.2
MLFRKPRRASSAGASGSVPLASSDVSSKRASTDFACSLTVACARRHAGVHDCTAAQQRPRLLRLNIRLVELELGPRGGVGRGL